MHSQPHMSIVKLIKAKNHLIYLGPQAWIHFPIKIRNFIEKKKVGNANRMKFGCIKDFDPNDLDEFFK